MTAYASTFPAVVRTAKDSTRERMIIMDRVTILHRTCGFEMTLPLNAFATNSVGSLYDRSLQCPICGNEIDSSVRSDLMHLAYRLDAIRGFSQDGSESASSRGWEIRITLD